MIPPRAKSFCRKPELVPEDDALLIATGLLSKRRGHHHKWRSYNSEYYGSSQSSSEDARWASKVPGMQERMCVHGAAELKLVRKDASSRTGGHLGISWDLPDHNKFLSVRNVNCGILLCMGPQVQRDSKGSLQLNTPKTTSTHGFVWPWLKG